MEIKMGRFFDIDSPMMRFLSKVADLMILNILMILCCIPVITAGAGIVGLHYVLLKMARNEEGYIAKGFFKSFKENFKQATVIWLIVLAFIGIFIADWVVFNFSVLQFPKVLKIVLAVLFVLVYTVACYVFPLLARFENTISNTFRNAFFMAILNFPKTLLMLVVYAMPVAVLYFLPVATPLVFLFGFSVPAYLAAMLYSGIFKRFEPAEEPMADEFSIDMEGFGMEPAVGDGGEKNEEL